MAATTTIPVKKIQCEGCEGAIRTALYQLDGVLQVLPSSETSQVTVRYDERALNEGGLRAKLVEAGYEPIA